jgi:hypothetical protein
VSAQAQQAGMLQGVMQGEWQHAMSAVCMSAVHSQLPWGRSCLLSTTDRVILTCCCAQHSLIVMHQLMS